MTFIKEVSENKMILNEPINYEMMSFAACSAS